MNVRKLHDFVLLNFLAKDRENAEEIMEAGNGYVVPGIVASDYPDVEQGIQQVKELKRSAEVISVGLGDGGNPANWEKVLQIAAGSNPGHINQPFERASFAAGYLQAKGLDQLVNALVVPTGTVGVIKLTSGLEIKVDEFVEMAAAMGIQSIKFMPVNGVAHLAELIYLTKVAAKKGIRGIEPAGGISVENIAELVNAVRGIDIEFFMPHIFGSTIDKVTGKTIPGEVKKIVQKIGG
jgi:2-dehydro-3-deoxy-phosphogluconate aldolase